MRTILDEKDKDELVSDYANRIIDGMDMDTVMELAYHYIVAEKSEYETDELLGSDIQQMDDLVMLPMKERSVEKYINPFNKDWEYRYYKALFDVEITDDRKKQICVNYLEGLEWTFSYYIEGCIDWRWCYNYHYAPLFKDLVKYIPHMDTQFLKRQEKQMIEDEKALIGLYSFCKLNRIKCIIMNNTFSIFENAVDMSDIIEFEKTKDSGIHGFCIDSKLTIFSAKFMYILIFISLYCFGNYLAIFQVWKAIV